MGVWGYILFLFLFLFPPTGFFLLFARFVFGFGWVFRRFLVGFPFGLNWGFAGASALASVRLVRVAAALVALDVLDGARRREASVVGLDQKAVFHHALDVGFQIVFGNLKEEANRSKTDWVICRFYLGFLSVYQLKKRPVGVDGGTAALAPQEHDLVVLVGLHVVVEVFHGDQS